MSVTYLQEVSHEVVDCDPPVQPLLLTTYDGGILELERQRAEVSSETLQDCIGSLFILFTYSREGNTSYLVDNIGGR